jgi:RHS repeat-associated protein
VGPVSGQTFAYDANDRITTETYDLNGNTLQAEGDSFAYDFEDRLVAINGSVGLSYDGDGNLASRSEAGVKTSYLVDDRNPTGWSQVVEEVVGGAVAQVYAYGQAPLRSGPQSFVADGHASVRLLVDSAGAVTGQNEYDSFGVGTRATGASHALSYVGERAQTAGLTFLRARHLRNQTGTFLGMDPQDGAPDDLATLHRVLYAAGDPVNGFDPSGRWTLPELNLSTVIQGINATMNVVVQRGYYTVVSSLALSAQKGFGYLSQAGRFGIQPYDTLKSAIQAQSAGLQAHHLLEQRFASSLGVVAKQMLSVAVTAAEHQNFTNQWRALIVDFA